MELNAGPNNLSHILSREDVGNLDDNFPNGKLFLVRMVATNQNSSLL